MTGQKIIDGLRDALDGDIARVIIDGVTWVRQPAPDSASPDMVRDALEATVAGAIEHYYQSPFSPTQPEGWACNMCGHDWETKQDEPEAHHEGCAMRRVYAALASLPASPAEPVAWRYDLATRRNAGTGEYSGWKEQITGYKPHVPPEGIRNLTPLYAAPPPAVAEAGDAGGEAVAYSVIRREAPALAGQLNELVETYLHKTGNRELLDEWLWDNKIGILRALQALATPSLRPEAETASRVDGATVDAEYIAAGLVIHRYEHGGGRVYFERGKSRDLVMDLFDEDTEGKRRDAIIAAVLASGVLRALADKDTPREKEEKG